jgi:hypothetical protein
MSKVYSESGEIFDQSDLEFLIVMFEENPDLEEITYYEGESVAYTAHEFISGDSIIDVAMENAYEEGGEFAEDWLDDIKSEDIEAIEKMVGDYLQEKYPPAFYNVVNVVEKTISRREALEEEVPGD